MLDKKQIAFKEHRQTARNESERARNLETKERERKKERETKRERDSGREEERKREREIAGERNKERLSKNKENKFSEKYFCLSSKKSIRKWSLRTLFNAVINDFNSFHLGS